MLLAASLGGPAGGAVRTATTVYPSPCTRPQVLTVSVPWVEEPAIHLQVA